MEWNVKAAVLTLAFLSLGSVVYLLFKKKRSEENEDDFMSLGTSRSAVTELKVPKKSLGLILGRNGSTIKEIQSKSGSKIRFSNSSDSDEYKTCLIRGTPESIELAEFLIHEVIVNQPLIENYEMYVPKEACGRIIGKNGENIRYISSSANAKIVVESIINVKEKNVSERKLIITGTSEQIHFAKILIEQKVEEENEYRNRIKCSLANRLPRNKGKYLLPNLNDSPSKETSKHKEKLVAAGSDGLLEVYVSATKNPEQFWVQMMGPCTVELDRLNEQMTDYYSKEENRRLHVLKEVTPGQIVAAPFSYDNKWYRAEVVSLKIDEYDPEKSEVNLYFVDYGDSDDLKRKDIFELKTDFLRLRFQAIECILAKIKSRESWSEEAVELFEELTHAALWKVVTARIHEYRERPANGKRGGSPVPCVELYDSRGSKTINVGEELVRKGFAEWREEEEEPPQPQPQPPRKREAREEANAARSRERNRANAEKWD